MIVVATVVVKALVCNGVVIDTGIELFAVDMPVDVLIILSHMAVGLLMDVLAGDLIIGVLTNTGVDANVNTFLSETTAFEFATPDPLEEFRC